MTRKDELSPAPRAPAVVVISIEQCISTGSTWNFKKDVLRDTQVQKENFAELGWNLSTRFDHQCLYEVSLYEELSNGAIISYFEQHTNN